LNATFSQVDDRCYRFFGERRRDPVDMRFGRRRSEA